MTRCKHEWVWLYYPDVEWCEACGTAKRWVWGKGDNGVHVRVRARYRYPRTLKKKGQGNG